MTHVRVEEFGLGNRQLMRKFAHYPWRLYRGDPCWTPPLNADLLGNKVLGTKGLLTSAHPYHRHADVTHFLAWRGSVVVGRVSGSIDHDFNTFHDCNVAFFGFFDVADDQEAANALLESVRSWAAARGASVLRGPGQYGCATHERQGVLVEGFEYEPTVDLTHNPPYLVGLLERAGFCKAMDYHAFLLTRETLSLDRVRRLADRVRARGEIRTRQGDVTHFNEEVRLLLRIYNEVWSENWGFMPISEDEADEIAATLKTIVDPGLIRFAYVGDEPAAVIGVLPDPYWALRPRWRWFGDSDAVRLARLMATRRHIPRLRAMFFGIREPYRRMGVDAVLFDEVFTYGLERGVYTSVDGSMALETNDLVHRSAEVVGSKRYKTWRIFEAPL